MPIRIVPWPLPAAEQAINAFFLDGYGCRTEADFGGITNSFGTTVQ